MCTLGIRRLALVVTCALILAVVSEDTSRISLEPPQPQGPPRAYAQEVSSTPVPTAGPSSTPTPIPTVTPAPDSGVEPTATPTPTPTPAPVTTGSGGLNVNLPALADTPSVAGTVAEGTVGPDGGQVSSQDGRVSVVLPAGATTGGATVRITQLDPNEYPPPEGANLVNAWNIEALTSGGAAKIDRFNAEVTLNLQFGPEILDWANPRTLLLWTWNDQAQAWVKASDQQPVAAGAISARTDHLSVWGVSADPAIDTAPFSNPFNLNLHSGAATASIPIELPPGPGGLVPELALTYDSSLMSSMRSNYSLGSWVGIGWDLSVGSIREVGADLSSSHPVPNYVLEVGGTAEMLYAKPGSDTEFLGYRHSYLKIKASRADCKWYHDGENPCTWTVTDKQGRKYTFGGTEDSLRYRIALHSAPAPYWRQRYYQWDLSRIEDTHGNQINITYWQQTAQPEDCGQAFQPPLW